MRSVPKEAHRIRLHKPTVCGRICPMDEKIPSTEEVRQRLLALRYGQVEKLALLSGVPLTTLWKVRSGDTENPGLDTVRKFYRHIQAVGAANA